MAYLWITGSNIKVRNNNNLLDGLLGAGGGYYEGDIVDGLAHGKGHLTRYNGETYVGDFEHGSI